MADRGSGWARARALGLFALALALTGCGGSPSTAGTSAGAATSASTTISAAAPAAAAATTTSAAPATATTSVGGAPGATADAATTATAQASSAAPASSAAGGVAAGRALYVSNGCIACHGDNAEGKIGPKIAGTGLSFAEVLHQVRQPRGQMPPFSAQQVNDAQVQQIYAYLESLAPPTPTPAPAAATSANAAAAKPVDVDAVAAAVADLKVASDYAKDASKTVGDVHNYGNQAATALKAAQAAVQTAIASGGGSAELKADLNQLRQELDAVAPDVQAAVAATSLTDAKPHTAKMVLASRLDLLPLALELVRVNGAVGAITGVVKDTAGKPVPQALVTIEGGKVHTGLLTDSNGAFQASGIAAFKTIEVKAYKAGYLYVESHAPVTKGGTANVVITIPVENHPDASPKVSDAAAPAGPVASTASVHLAMNAVQKDNNIAEDQLWALSPQAGVAYVLRSTGNNQYALDQPLPGLKPGAYTWYFFATTHDCDMSNVEQQQMTVQ